MDRLTPITPGELLDEEFLQPLGDSQYRLAKAIDVPSAPIRICASAVFWD
jgi:plasmid maintenance system antidote protein VapI